MVHCLNRAKVSVSLDLKTCKHVNKVVALSGFFLLGLDISSSQSSKSFLIL